MEKKHVTWTIFVWAISLILIIVGIVGGIAATASTNAQNAKETVLTVTSQIKTDVEVLKTDVGWIRDTLKKLDTKEGAQLRANLMGIVRVIATSTWER